MKEFFYKMNEIEHILVSLENFILGFIGTEDENFESIQSTYGYYLANEKEKTELKKIYNLIKSNIDNLEVIDKLFYKKSMLGIIKMRELSKFIDDNLYEIINADFDALIDIIANKLKESEICKIIPKIINNNCIQGLLKMWINGESYIQIWNRSKLENLLIKWGKTSKKISLEDIIILCDSDFGYVSLAIIQAIIEVLNTKESCEKIIDDLNDIIYKIKYGLPNRRSVYIYELGFADRIISQKIANEISEFDCSTKKKIKYAIKNKKEKLKELLLNYPSYFIDRLEKIGKNES